ncbi:MAG TPA: NRDE family protein [Burkholderiales bacterium]|jgi:uncharacterized protein with NRDE domain|nr:NRDE family protein [Burkholderiales bacterium]
MCLILVAARVHPGFPLIVAANRDEYHARPSEPAGFWKDRPGILAGRDLEAGGTWMGVSRNGRFAAVTNYRGARDANALESRGALVTRFLEGNASAAAFVSDVAQRGNTYSGFNLFADDGDELWWCTNRDGAPRHLDGGIYGLGNFLLDTPELVESKTRFSHCVEPGPAIEPLFTVLAAAKIIAPEYGTRCSTVVLKGDDDRLQFAERPFDAAGAEGVTARYEFKVRP